MTTGQYAPNWRVSNTQLIRNTRVLRIKLPRPPQYARIEVRFQYAIHSAYTSLRTAYQGSTVRNTLCTAHPHAYPAYPVGLHPNNTQEYADSVLNAHRIQFRTKSAYSVGQKCVFLQIHASGCRHHGSSPESQKACYKRILQSITDHRSQKIHKVAPSVAFIAPTLALARIQFPDKSFLP